MSINRETLDAVFTALDAATIGPWKTVGSTHCNGVGGDFGSLPGAFKLVCGDSTGANCDAIVAAVNWLRENRDALTAQPAAAPGIDLHAPCTEAVYALARKLLWIAYVWNDHNFDHPYKIARKLAQEFGIESFDQANAWLDEQAKLIDASPKGGRTAPRFELTNGQIAQLHDFAGTPEAGTPLEDQDVLVIQSSDTGHSGPGLYAHYDELPEEGAIYLDGQLPGSPKGGGDGTNTKKNCPPPSWMFPDDEDTSAASVTDWRAKAAAWLEEQAAEQENTNKAYPAHVAAYPSWTDRVHWLRTLASKVSESQATSAEVGA